MTDKSVLMELRPCFDGFAGIPQDTRITYDLLSGMEGIKLGGHLLDKGMGTVGFKWNEYKEHEKKVIQQSNYIIALEDCSYRQKHLNTLHRSVRLLRNATVAKASTTYLMNKLFGQFSDLHTFNSDFFNDYIWRSLFEKSLPAEKMEQILSTKFVAGSSSYPFLSGILASGLPPININTKDWDVYIAQTPFPAKISKNTQMVVRFHDAVPIQYPHTINNPYHHQRIVARGLRMASKDAWFVCNSESTRKQLLSIVPEVEKRTDVVHCCVPNIFFEDKEDDVSNIIIKRSASGIASVESFTDIQRYKRFVKHNFNNEYFICVGTMEPRKNYNTVLAAWDRYRKESGRDVKLVIVGSAGWNTEALMDRIKGYTHDGNLFLMNNVPLYELRKLYSNAKATLIASYSEGFSYSGIESMRCKTPVIASGIDVHHEVYGEHALYFNPYAASEMCSQMKALTDTSDAGIKKLAEDAFTFSLRYSEENQKDEWARFLTQV